MSEEKKQIKALLFGLEGFIEDIEYIQYLSWQNVLRDYGFELSKEDYLDLFLFKHAATALRGMLPYTDIHTLYNITKKKEEKFIEIVGKRKLKASKGLRTFLSDVNAQKTKVVCALVTDLSIAETECILKHLGMSNAFDIIFSSFGVKKPKPNPAIYEIALEKLNVESDACIVFEGTPEGVCSAKFHISNIIGITSSGDAMSMFNEGAKCVFKDFSSLKFIYLTQFCE